MLLSCFLCAVFVVVDCVCVFAAVVVDSSLVVFSPEYNMCVYGVETGSENVISTRDHDTLPKRRGRKETRTPEGAARQITSLKHTRHRNFSQVTVVDIFTRLTVFS